MATFAPQIDANIAYEQPQQAVENTAGETLVKGFSSLFADMARTTKSSKKTGPDPLVNSFMDGMRKIEAQRSAGQEDRATINERILVQNFVASGGELNGELKSTVEAMTGRPFSYMGQTEDQRQIQALTQSQGFQTAYLAGRATLGPDASQEELTQFAIKSASEQAVAADTIARLNAGESVNWELQGAAAYDALITNVHQTSIGGLTMITERGGILTPNDVLGSKQQWDMLKASALKRPRGISDDQWKPIQDRMDRTDKLFETLTTAASSDQAMENLSSMLVQSMGPASDMTFDELVTANVLVKSPETIWDNAGINAADAVKTLSARSADLMKQATGARLVDTVNETSAEGAVAGNTIIKQIPEEWSSYKGKSPRQHAADLKAGGVLMSSVTPQSINKPGAAEQFADGMQSTGVVLMSADNFISSKLMRELVGSENIRANLKALEAIDPEAATEARVLMRSGLESQTTMLRTNVEQIETTAKSGGHPLDLVWDETTKTYYATGEGFQEFFRQTYGNNNFNAVNVEGKGIPVRAGDKWMTDAVEQAYDRRSALGIANRAMKDFAIEEPARPVDVKALQGESLDVISQAYTAMGWDETQQNEDLKNYLSAGGVDIDPDKTAWCAAFVNATLQKTGINGTGMLNARSFLNWGEEVKEPVKGDVVVFSRGNDPAKGHVGFFMGFDPNGNIMVLGGNQGDAVNIKSYPAKNLLGYRRANGQPLPVKGSTVERQAAEQVQAGLYGDSPVGRTLSASPEQPTTEGIPFTGTADVETITDAMQLAGLGAKEATRTEPSVDRQSPEGMAAPTGASEVNQLVEQLTGVGRVTNASPTAQDLKQASDTFNSPEEFRAAVANGEVKKGDKVVVLTNGKVQIVEVN